MRHSDWNCKLPSESTRIWHYNVVYRVLSPKALLTCQRNSFVFSYQRFSGYSFRGTCVRRNVSDVPLILTLVLMGLALPSVWRERVLAAQALGGEGFSEERLQRVREQLPDIGCDPETCLLYTSDAADE